MSSSEVYHVYPKFKPGCLRPIRRRGFHMFLEAKKDQPEKHYETNHYLPNGMLQFSCAAIHHLKPADELGAVTKGDIIFIKKPTEKQATDAAAKGAVLIDTTGAECITLTPKRGRYGNKIVSLHVFEMRGGKIVEAPAKPAPAKKSKPKKEEG